jgi:ketosteroid isomerase-like protein
MTGNEMAPELGILEQRIARLESIEEIKQLQVEYGRACDADLDADRIAALFAEDGSWEGGAPPSTFTGRAEVRGHFIEARSRLRWSSHFMIGPQIHVDESGTRAWGSWYLLEPATFAENSELRSYWLTSVYDMEYVRDQEGTWLVQRMTLKPPMRAPFEAEWGI